VELKNCFLLLGVGVTSASRGNHEGIAGLYALALAESNLSPGREKRTRDHSYALKRWMGMDAELRVRRKFEAESKGVAASDSPSSTAIFAPGPTYGASDHLSFDASTEMKSASSPATYPGGYSPQASQPLTLLKPEYF